jgi:hypothetical protein
VLSRFPLAISVPFCAVLRHSGTQPAHQVAEAKIEFCVAHRFVAPFLSEFIYNTAVTISSSFCGEKSLGKSKLRCVGENNTGKYLVRPSLSPTTILSPPTIRNTRDPRSLEDLDPEVR